MAAASDTDLGGRIAVSLPLSSILKYIDQPGDTSRCLQEAEAVYDAGHVVECVVEAIRGDRICIAAFVLQSSGLSSPPHNVTIEVERKQVVQSHCSCKAGNYKCKHIVATLVHVKEEKSLEQLSPTDKPQQWGRMHKGHLEVEYEPRVLDLPCITKINIEEPATVSGNILQRLLRGFPYDCTAKTHIECVTRCAPSRPAQEQITEVTPPKTLKGAICEILKVAEQAGNKLSPQQVFESLCEQYSNDDIQAIECITTGQSENKCWFEHRIGMITASVAHNVYTRVHTIRTKMGPHDVRALLKLVMRESKVTTADLRRGVKLEAAAKSAYLSQNKKHNHLKIHGRGLCVLQHRPFLGASPDGVVSCACCPARLIEVKCPKSLEQFVRSEVCHGSDPMQLKEKSRYFSQVQVQMGITGLATADVFVYVSDTQTITLNVSFSKEYFDSVVERATFFFLHYVLPHIVQSAS